MLANLAGANSFSEIYWEDKLMPFVGANWETNAAAVSAGQNNPDEAIYRCPADTSVRQLFLNAGAPDGWANRTSYLLNSQLSDKTRRWGRWPLDGFTEQVGTSLFIAYVERNAAAILADTTNAGDPRQDDYDIWLDISIFQNWQAYNRHGGYSNYPFMDGHIASYAWAPLDPTNPAAIFQFPDTQGATVPTIRTGPPDTPLWLAARDRVPVPGAVEGQASAERARIDRALQRSATQGIAPGRTHHSHRKDRPERCRYLHTAGIGLVVYYLPPRRR